MVPAFRGILSSRFLDPTSITYLKMAYADAWPCNHSAMDDFLEADLMQRLVDNSGPADDFTKLHRAISDGAFERIISNVTGIPKLKHARSSVRAPVNPDPCNHLGRHGIYWKRAALVIMKSVEVPVDDEGDAAGLEIWKNLKETTLAHRIPWKRNRAIFLEIRPDLLYSFTPEFRSLDVFWEEFYTIEAPPWVNHGWRTATLDRTRLKRALEARNA